MNSKVKTSSIIVVLVINFLAKLRLSKSEYIVIVKSGSLSKDVD